jgi:hypothetical protein
LRIEQPLGEHVGTPLWFEAKGPATVVYDRPLKPNSQTRTTTTIDELVRSGIAPRVDFIKMDIEGAELDALRGAMHTLRRDRPRLAISLYHRISDFETIPRFLASLELGYRFYLDHYTIHAEETVLFATAEKPR